MTKLGSLHRRLLALARRTRSSRLWRNPLARYAALALAAALIMIAADDPRFVATVDALEKALARWPFMMRYEEADDFGLPQTAFNVCSFWRIDALARLGRADEARAIFEAMLARRNALGLLSEDIAPASGELWGNFPQTYSMVGLIVCAMRLSRSWEEAFWRDS